MDTMIPTGDPTNLFFIIIPFILLVSLILWLIFRHWHSWGEWVYETDNSCRQIRSCQTCKVTTIRENPHNWGGWIYEADNSCRQIRSCQRCGQKDQEEAPIQHNLGEWKYEFVEPQQKYASLVRQVYQKLDDKFSDSELRELCLGVVDYEDLPGVGQQNKARELVLHMERHHRIPELIKLINENRPDVSLGDSEKIKKLLLPENLSTQSSFFEVDPTLSCNQLRVCIRCKQEEHKEEHRWNDWEYESLTACQLVRNCKICGKKETGEEAPHKWSNWDYKSPRSCEQVRRCTRCGKEESGGEAPHTWSDWEYEGSHSCSKVRRCTRCEKEEGGKEADHTWSDWESQLSNSDGQERTCERCGKTELRTKRRE